jgi:uncharacterized protein (TIGR02118 family)
MIHKLIFVNARPRMSQSAFERHWKEVHAVEFGSKIPQVRGYLIDTCFPCGPQQDAPLFNGVAEVWLENEREELAFFQSHEYVEGARRDEPRFLAFWQTLALDTTAHLIMSEESPQQEFAWIKLLLAVKRKPGMALEAFRDYSLDTHASHILQLPGLRRYMQCHTNDSHYLLGEAPLDCVSQLWFDSIEALERALASTEYAALKTDWTHFVDTKYLHRLAAREYWVIVPEVRHPIAHAA